MDAPLRQYFSWNRFPDDLTASEITHFFSLSEDERRTVDRRRRPLNRLGVALQIGFLRLAGTPLNSVEMIPPRVLAHLGIELGIAPPRRASIGAVYRRLRTLFEHQEVAKRILGLHDLTEHGERALNGHLRREAGDQFLMDDLERTARAWLADYTVSLNYTVSRKGCSPWVFYPGLVSDPSHGVATAQLSKFAGVLSFSLVGGEGAAIQLLTRSNSRVAHGVPEALIRHSCGMEDVADLVNDLDATLGAVGLVCAGPFIGLLVLQ